MILDIDNDDVLIERLYDMYAKYNELKARHNRNYHEQAKTPLRTTAPATLFPSNAMAAIGSATTQSYGYSSGQAMQQRIEAETRTMHQSAAIDQLRNQLAISAILPSQIADPNL